MNNTRRSFDVRGLRHSLSRQTRPFLAGWLSWLLLLHLVSMLFSRPTWLCIGLTATVIGTGSTGSSFSIVLAWAGSSEIFVSSIWEEVAFRLSDDTESFCRCARKTSTEFLRVQAACHKLCLHCIGIGGKSRKQCIPYQTEIITLRSGVSRGRKYHPSVACFLTSHRRQKGVFVV